MHKRVEYGVFMPVGEGGWIRSTTAPPVPATYALNRQVALLAEELGLDFLLAMAKWRGVFAVSKPAIKTEVEQTRGLEAGGALSAHCDLNKADTLYLEALEMMDPQELEAAVRRINAATYEDYWAIPLASRSEPWAARTGIVSDWRPVPLGPVYLRFETAVPGPEVL